MTQDAPKVKSSFLQWLSRKEVYPLLFAALLLFHFSMNVWWLSADNHTIRTDEEGHMLMARNYHEALFSPHGGTFFERLAAMSRIQPGIPVHPPLLHLLGAFIIQLIGYSPDRIAAVTTLLLLAALAGVWRIARRFLDPAESLFAVFATSFTPLMFAGSRYFMTDYLAMTIAVWTIYVLLRTDRFFDTTWVFVFAWLNGLGILARTPAFLYWLIPSIVVFAAGVREAARQAYRPAYRVLAFNAIMAITVSAGVAAPWYYHNLDRFYTYWTHDHQVGVDLASHSPESAPELAAPKLETPRTVLAQVLPLGGGKPDPAKGTAVDSGLLDRVLHPRVPWSRYPVHIIENAMFLPLFLLALVGMIVALCQPRFRTFEVLLLFCWVFGAWILMTVLFKFATVRYTLQVLPPMAVFAAMAVLAISKRTLRRTAMGALAVYLLFVYGNLTVHAYGPLRQVGIRTSVLPFPYPDEVNQRFVLYRDQLTMAFSYAQMGAPVHENFKDRLFSTLLDQEQIRGPLISGAFANYVKINVRGMEFEQRHYWPEPNPYRRRDLPPDRFPSRRLTSIGMGRTPQDVAQLLPMAEYVVYAVDRPDESVEQDWIAQLEQAGFSRVDRFEWGAFGYVPKRIFGVMARSLTPPKRIDTRQDIDAMELSELNQLIEGPGFGVLSPDHQAYARQRLDDGIAAIAKPSPMVDGVSFMAADMKQEPNGTFAFRLIFRADQDIHKKYRIYFHGLVSPEYASQLPEQYRKYQRQYWNFDPSPPTATWRAGQYVFVSHRIQPQPIPYDVIFGFMDEEEKVLGNAVALGVFDFAKYLKPAPAQNAQR